jgi:hypothetical protein
MMVSRGKPNTQENPFWCHFDRHESRMKPVGIELGPPCREAIILQPELWYGICLIE